MQAFPAVNELLDRGGDAGDVIVNLHAQLNMLGGLMVILIGAALSLLPGGLRSTRSMLVGVGAGMAVYYAGGIAFAAVAAHRVAGGGSFGAAVVALEPWQALVLVPAALAVAVGFGAYGRAAWRATAAYRAEGRRWLRRAPSAYAGRIPKRVRRRRPAAVAVYEVPMGLLGFPGLGWLFAGYPLAGSALLLIGPAIAWAAIPLAFTPFANGPLRPVGWQAEWIWLPASTLVSTVLLYSHIAGGACVCSAHRHDAESCGGATGHESPCRSVQSACSSWPSRLCLLSQGSAALPSATPTRPDSRVRSPASSW